VAAYQNGTTNASFAQSAAAGRSFVSEHQAFWRAELMVSGVTNLTVVDD
jgi:hypothetical protein